MSPHAPASTRRTIAVVAETAQSERFLAESALIVRRCGAEDLDRHGGAGVSIERAKDVSRAATADWFGGDEPGRKLWWWGQRHEG